MATRDDTNALFEGRDPQSSDLGPVAAFFESLHKMVPKEVPALIEERHLAVVKRALADGAPARTLTRYTTSVRALFAPSVVKVAALTAFVLLIGGSLAATGRMPAWQDQIADAVDFVIDLPGGTDDDDAGDSAQDDTDPDDTKADKADRSDPSDGERDDEDRAEDGSGSASTGSGGGTTTGEPEGSDIEDGEDEDFEADGNEETETTEDPDDSDADDKEDAGDPESDDESASGNDSDDDMSGLAPGDPSERTGASG